MGSPRDCTKLPSVGNRSKTYLKLGEGVQCVRKMGRFKGQSQSMCRGTRPSPRSILLDCPHSQIAHSHLQLKALSNMCDGPVLKGKDLGNAESCHLPPSLMHRTPLRNEGSGFLEIESNKISCHLPEDSAAHEFSHTHCCTLVLWIVLWLVLQQWIRFKL